MRISLPSYNKSICSSKPLLGGWAVLHCLAMLHVLFLCYEFIKASFYINIDSSSSLPTRTLIMKIRIFLKTDIYFKKIKIFISDAEYELTLPSDKPQIHYTICKMEKTLHNRYIFIIISFRTSNQKLFFSPQLFCKQFSPNPIFSCILLTERERHFPGDLLIM